MRQWFVECCYVVDNGVVWICFLLYRSVVENGGRVEPLAEDISHIIFSFHSKGLNHYILIVYVTIMTIYRHLLHGSFGLLYFITHNVNRALQKAEFTWKMG